MSDRVEAKIADEVMSGYLTAREGATVVPDDFEDFCERYVRIVDRDGNSVPFVMNRAQRYMYENMTNRNIVLKARQIGSSTFWRVYITWLSWRRRVSSACIAHDNETTQKLRRMDDRFFSETGRFMGVTKKMDNMKTLIYGPHGSEVTIATAGGKGNAGLGGTYQIAHSTEVAFQDAAADIDSGVMQGVPRDGIIVYESTAAPIGATGFFYEQVMAAKAGLSGYRLFFFPWWWEEEYRVPIDHPLELTDEERLLIEEHGLDHEQIAWRRRKKAEMMGSKRFNSMYPESVADAFIPDDDGYFKVSEATFSAPLDVTLNDAWGEHTPHTNSGRFVAGLDFGQAEDYTVLVVLDTWNDRQVDYLRMNKMPWAEMLELVAEKALYWNALVYAEANAMGGPNIETLRELRVDVVAFYTSRRSKPRIIKALKHSLDNGLTLQPHMAMQVELRSFQARSRNDGDYSYAAPHGGHDDTVIALALANWGSVTGNANVYVEVMTI
jgi:hypothetical protein